MLPSDIESLLNDLETGRRRAAFPTEAGESIEWVVDKDVKTGILAAFRAGNLVAFDGAYEGFVDKHNLPARRFSPEQRIRMVPGGSSVRRGAYLASGVVMMPPSYVNVGAYVDEGSMIDSHALVGSCAQIGKRVHLSAGVQIGGVLEPVGMTPVVIEDDCFIGADAVVVEGIRVRQGAVLAPGVILSRSVQVHDAVNGVVLEPGSAIPSRAVVVPGARPARGEWAASMGLSVHCPIIVKYRDAGSDAALELETALR
jgi:2,3,4,5-tetrahydropyridine-2-carboxylate N-succinyltransferase